MVNTATGTRPLTGQVGRFRALLERDGISWFTAKFLNRDTEKRFKDYLVAQVLPTERLIWALVIFTFFFYGLLDYLAVREHFIHFWIVRLIAGGAILFLVPLSFAGPFKKNFGWLSAAAILISSLSIIYMIAVMRSDEPPPYILGVLVVFIATSCIMRIPFILASTIYTLSSLAYVGVLIWGPANSQPAVSAGLFFMISITTVAIVTIYLQEIRARAIWLREEQQKEDAQTIEDLLIEATAADRSKLNFLSIMSHELRTPLHQIIGYAQIADMAMQKEKSYHDNSDSIRQIEGAADHLLAKIKKMLRYADTVAGKIKYEPSLTSIIDIVDATHEQMRQHAEARGIRINVQDVPDANIFVDIFHTSYALNNLVENAINATPDCGVVDITGVKGPDGVYNLKVSDKGPGMSPDKIQRALKPFAQTEDALNRSNEGVGLGLTIAKRMLEDQHAFLKISSTVGQGTTVVVSFDHHEQVASQGLR